MSSGCCQTGFWLCGEVSEHLLLDSPLLKHAKKTKPKPKKHSSVFGAPGALYVCIAPLCSCVLQDQSTSPAKTSSPCGKHPWHRVLVPWDAQCLPLPGTAGQAPTLPPGLGTTCFEHQWHGKQEQMWLWALLAHVPGTGRGGSSGTAACTDLPRCCRPPRCARHPSCSVCWIQ